MPDKNWGTQSLTPAQQQSLSDVLQRFDMDEVVWFEQMIDNGHGGNYELVALGSNGEKNWAWSFLIYPDGTLSQSGADLSAWDRDVEF
jgi:hypothetical protein